MLDQAQLDQVLDRAMPMGSKARLRLAMDLEKANEAVPLDLVKLYAFPDFDFWHDIQGITANIDRERIGPGHLKNCFLPRCARLDGSP